MKKRVLKVLGLAMIMMLVITSLPIQGVAFAADTNSLKSSTVVSLEKVDINKEGKVAFLPPHGQEDVIIGDGTGFVVEVNVPSRATLTMSFPDDEHLDVIVVGGDSFNLIAPGTTSVLFVYSDDDDSGQVFENVKVEYVGVTGKHVLDGPLTLSVGEPFDGDNPNTVIDYITSWKGEAENPEEENFNLWIAADDMFTAYMNGIQVGAGSVYSAIYKFNVAVQGNDLIAARAADTSGTDNIAGFKLILETSVDSYVGTDTSWYYHIGDPPVYFDGDQNIEWYQPGYMGDGWLLANEVLIPEHTWTTDWPSNDYLWIWAPKYDFEIHGSIDNPVYFRNGHVDGIAPEVFIDPDSKFFGTPFNVTLTSDDSSATIYYKLDNGSFVEYTVPFEVSSTVEVTAYAEDEYGNKSSEKTETYTLDAKATVDVTPESTSFKGSLEITITTTDDSTIYYTTDGSLPSETNGVEYTSPFTITEDTVVKAFAVDDFGNEATDEEEYVADNEADVDITPESTSFKGNLEITITTTDESTIYYTTDGTVPSETNGIEYTSPFTITVDTVVKAFAVDGFGNEATDEEEYIADNETFVTITPESTAFNGLINVTITSEVGATIYYTTNGDEPTTDSNQYSDEFTVSSTTTVKALAVDSVGNTATDEETYTLDESMPPISITPISQEFDNPLTVTIISEGENPIYYTTDGNEPDGTSTLYVGPFEVSETTVVKAIAYNYLETASRIAMETYTFVPTVFIPEEGSESVEATNITLRYGYNRTPEEGYKDLAAIVTPLGFDVNGSTVFSVFNGDAFIDLIDNRVSYETAGIAEVLVSFSYHEGEELKTITDTVQVTVEFYPTPPVTPPVTPPETPPTSTPAPTVSIRLDRDPVELEYGTEAFEELLSYDLTETIVNSGSSAVTWTIDDDTVATVDENGIVTAVRQGETTVTVRHTSSGATATSEVIVFLVGDEPNPLGLVEFFDPYVFGYPDQSFRPKNSVTRAEVATMFAKILKLNVDYSGSQKFDDVTPDAWYYNYVQAIKRTDIFIGDTAGNFRPDEPITRAEMATVFGKFWEYMKTPVDRNAVVINDVDGTHWASKYIYMMYNAGIVTGFEDGTYRPNDPTLREQVVGMINTLIARPEFDAPVSKFIDINNSHWAFGNIEAASQPFANQQNIPVTE